MAAVGYNTVRVFLDGICPSRCVGRAEGGISSSYVENVADFLRRADHDGIEVILTTDSAPLVGGYGDGAASGTRGIGGLNADYLTLDGVDANARFWHDFIVALENQGAPIRDILAFELRNEFHYDLDARPFNLNTGTVLPADGRAYDMGSLVQKEEMADNGAVYWVDRVAAAVRSADPGGLVSVGVSQISPSPPNQMGPVPAMAILDYSTADILDVHFYPDTGLPFSIDAQETGLTSNPKKFVLMGELGVTHGAQQTVSTAASEVRRVVAESCSAAVGGWLIWTWNTYQRRRFWTASEAHDAFSRSSVFGSKPCGG
jgi:endo-1,4-beta-mannosidase